MRSTRLRAPPPVSSGRHASSACAAMPLQGAGAAQHSALLCGWAPFRRRKLLGMRITPGHASLLSGREGGCSPAALNLQPAKRRRACCTRQAAAHDWAHRRRARMHVLGTIHPQPPHSPATSLPALRAFCRTAQRHRAAERRPVVHSGSSGCNYGGQLGCGVLLVRGRRRRQPEECAGGMGEAVSAGVPCKHCSLEMRAAAPFVPEIACTARCV